MILTTTASILTNALRTLSAVVERRNTIPVLGCVKFDGNKLTATDLDIEISVTIPTSVADGSTCVDHRSLLALLLHVPGNHNVTIAGRDGAATVSFHGGRYDLPGISPDDFPTASVVDLTPVEIDGDALVKALRFTLPFVSSEETRYYLNGICLDGENAVATDGHRLGSHPLGSTISGRPIIHRKACRIMGAMPAPKLVGISANGRLVVEYDGARVVSKLIDGTFPDWRRILPAITGNTPKVAIKPASTIAAMHRLASISRDGSPYITLAYAGSHVAAVRRRIGEVEAREFFSGASASHPGTVAFNAHLLKGILSGFKSADTVTLKITDAGSPILIDDGSNAAFAVLMPARTGEEKLALSALDELRSSNQVGRAA